MNTTNHRHFLSKSSFVSALLLLSLFTALASGDTNGVAKPLRIAFFYNSAIFTDDRLRTNTDGILNNGTNVQVFPLTYRRADEFRKAYKENILQGTNSWDLVLGPTESAALKALNDSLEAKQEIPFLAPFITTPPKAYRRLTLVPASPPDDEQVKMAIGEFVQYTTSRTVAILHTDDLWGHAFVKNFRDGLETRQTIVHSQPVEEFTEEDSDEQNVVADNKLLYRSFLEKMRESGASVIGVALLTAESHNQFFETLHQFNGDLLVKYKPTLLLLSQPGFDQVKTDKGVLYRYLAEFNVFYVANTLRKNPRGTSTENADLAPYLDACRIIARAAQVSADSGPNADWHKTAVKLVQDFYKGSADTSKFEPISTNLLTGYHATKLHFDEKQIEMTKASANHDKLLEKPVSKYFEGGYIAQLFFSGWFFLLHHRALWNLWTLVLFTLVALGSFIHVIKLKSERPPWILLKTRAFWSLFALNLLITYGIWVLSIYFGVFGDSNIGAALTLAAACPTAASALGDIARRYLPIDVTGIIRIIENINFEMLKRIGKEQLDKYKAELEKLDLDSLKSMFFEVLFLKLTSDDLRNRIHEHLDKGLAELQDTISKMKDGTLKENRQKLERQMYADSLLTALGYLCSSENELGTQVNALLTRNVSG